MKVSGKNLKLLNRRLTNLYPKSFKNKKLKNITKDFMRRHIIEYKQKYNRSPLVEDVFDPIVGALIDELKKHFKVKITKIIRFIAQMFVRFIG